MLTEHEFDELLAIGYETRGREFKGSGPRTSRELFARIVRAMLGMSNKRDGGYVIVGVEQNQNVLSAVGVADADVPTWNFDDIAAGLSAFADPHVEFELQILQHIEKSFVVLAVEEFAEIPVLCRKGFTDNTCRPPKEILRDGACYVRSRRKPETSEIATQTDMRELLDLATEKGVRKVLRHLGQERSTLATADDATKFELQLRRK